MYHTTSKINSKVAHSRKRLLWHLNKMENDQCAKDALYRLDKSLHYCGGYQDVLAITKNDAFNEIERTRRKNLKVIT